MSLIFLSLLLQAAPATISRQAIITDSDKGFAAADSNRDGRLSPAEVQAAANRRVGQTRAAILQQREAAFRQMDSNRDGRLTLQEYNAAAARQQISAPPLATIMAGLDANRDGFVSQEENRRPVLQQFDRADRNRDGKLTAADKPR